MRKPRQRNSTRDREKAELVTLRSLSRELEAHVAALSRGERPQSQLIQSQYSADSAWRSLSNRQERARRAAERTNRDLNERVQSNADWIQRLWELLCEKRRAVDASSLVRMATLHQQADDDLVLCQLKAQAQSALPQMPMAFAEHGIHLFDESGRCDGVNLLTDRWSNTKQGDLESTLVCVRRIPFDVHSTSATLWTALSCPKNSFASENDCPIDAKIVERTPDICCHKSQYSIQVEDKTELVNFHAAVRRSKNPEPQAGSLVSSPSGDSSAITFLWKSSFTLANGSTRHADTMWASVVRSQSHPLESVVTVVCQSQLALTPGPYAASLQAGNMQVVGGCVDSIISSVENMLLDDRWHGAARKISSMEGSPTQTIDL